MIEYGLLVILVGMIAMGALHVISGSTTSDTCKVGEGLGGGTPCTYTLTAAANGSTTKLTSVSCPTSSFCMAVGASDSETWNGSVWTDTGSFAQQAYSVSCPSASLCFATGFNSGFGHLYQWTSSGGWSGVQSTTIEYLSISCVSNFCMTVPWEPESNSYPVLVWNGSSWSSAGYGGPMDVDDFTAVGCASSTFCLLTGLNSATCYPCTIYAETYTGGSTYTSIPTVPQTGDQQATLNAVSCPSATWCMAVGADADTGAISDIWTGGTSLTAATVQQTSGADDQLLGVSCFSAGSCMASGYTVGGTGANEGYAVMNFVPPFISGNVLDTYSGGKWSVGSASGSQGLSEISCITSTECMALGYGVIDATS